MKSDKLTPIWLAIYGLGAILGTLAIIGWLLSSMVYWFG